MLGEGHKSSPRGLKTSSLQETALLPLVLTPAQPPLGIPRVKGTQKAPRSRGPLLLGSLLTQQAALCPVGPQRGLLTCKKLAFDEPQNSRAPRDSFISNLKCKVWR